MRAVAYHRFGGPEVLETVDLPTPLVGPDSVLVRVRAAGVNPVDWKVRQGHLQGLLDHVFPVVPGWDVAGVVEKVGLDTPEFQVGDEVVGYVRKDVMHGGTTAELVAAPVRTLARKPESLSWAEAGGLPLAGLTAYQALRRLGVGEGDTVLVHNAAGGVGSFAVQVARAFGARVIGTASERNHERVRGFGGEPVPYGDGMVEAVRALVPGGVDAVLDLVGGGVATTTSDVGTAGVRLASVADGSVTQLGGAYVWVRPDAADLAALGALADEGRLTVPVAATFGLEQTADAHRLSEEGHAAGKVVVTVD
ncbi:NADP-dependent oxidoreductase [Cellulomonas marina]|uniref:NADPH:quinone reductase n=1 Tax=Cellulomonas marina TaxID=988821 RepID=A0A1I0YZT5_9CELL|nr:NADP-dependent oxidoreductase [Cellulomonas marina]GIG28145.1 oxidoreductase [Cellulomonas marina]SFB18949.1 NADPH:quinone reductase [Cellulomonas marina]